MFGKSLANTGDTCKSPAIPLLSCVGTAILLCACAPQVKEAPVATTLAPMEKPAIPDVGTKVVQLLNGTDEHTIELVAKDDNSMSWTSSAGCSFTLPTSGFGPATKFNNCEGNSGTQKIELVSGSPWPLSVGKKWRYTQNGQNLQGDTWQGARNCEVTSEARVTVPKGTYDTFKIVCNDRWRVRTYYISPELGRSAVFVNHHKRRNETKRYELIRVE